MSSNKKLMVAAAVATIIGAIVAVDAWRSGGTLMSRAEGNSGNRGVIVGGGNSGTINNNITKTAPAAADLSNASMTYINAEAGRRFRCVINDAAATRQPGTPPPRH